MPDDRNDMAYWFPKLAATGVPVPRTEIVETAVELDALLDGNIPPGYVGFILQLHAAACRIGAPPYFLRTGHTSDKHRWRRTCYVQSIADIATHVTALVESSALADIMGLPTATWAIREFLKLKHSFTAFDGMPIAREFRTFIAGGDVLCVHPYWPEAAIKNPSSVIFNWRTDLSLNSLLSVHEMASIVDIARTVSAEMDGAWSLDIAQRDDGSFVAIDMAEASRSWHWPDCQRQSITFDVAEK